MPKNYCIMQIWAESGKSALPICNYSQILYQFLTFTQNLKRSLNSAFLGSCTLFKLLGGEIYLAVSRYTFVRFILHIHLISHFCVPHLKFLEPKWSQLSFALIVSIKAIFLVNILNLHIFFPL